MYTKKDLKEKGVERLKNKKQPHEICGAKTRSGTPCKNKPMPNGRCRLHGGLSTGPPKGNKNAVKTGEFETIWEDTLSDEEKKLMNKISLNTLEQLDSEIKLTEIRERRMLQRIAALKDKAMVVTSSTIEQTGFISEGIKPKHFEETTTETRENSINLITNIEEGLTRVQNHKKQLIEAKHKIETGDLDKEMLEVRIEKEKATTSKIKKEIDSDIVDPIKIEIVSKDSRE